MDRTYFERVRPTYLECWPEALVAFSITGADLPLTRDGAIAIGSQIRGHGLRFAPAPLPVEGLRLRIDDALRAFPVGAFMRLGSGSAKDSCHTRLHGMRITDGYGAVNMFRGGSGRLAFDLELALRHDYEPHLFLRQWHEIPLWSEFRCFFIDRDFAGASQYHCRNGLSFPEVVAAAPRIKAALKRFAFRLTPHLHLPDVVADLFIAGDPGRDPAIYLLELNPFFEFTEACLFNWKKHDFDGSLRYLKMGVPAFV